MSDTLTQCSVLMGNCDTLISSWLGILLIPATILSIWFLRRQEIRRRDDQGGRHIRPLYLVEATSIKTEKEDVPAPGMGA